MTKYRIIIAIILLCLFASCTSQTSPTKTEPIEFSVLYNDHESIPFNEDWRILQEYKTRKNVTLNVQLGDNSDYDKDLIQALESSNPPDIILKVWPNQIESFAANGVLLPFSDYMDLMPHFQAYVEEHNLESELEKLKLENGKFYILPGYQRKIQVQQWIYRKDAFKANNLPVPETYDELYDALVTLKEIYPDSSPISATWGGAHLFAMMGAGYDIPTGWNGKSDFNQEENRWLYTPAEENYKAMLQYLNRCYEAGILDPEIFTQDDDTFYTKLQDGSTFVTVTWITSGFDNWNELLAENGIPEGEWAPLPVPESTIGIRALPAVDPFRKGLVVPANAINKPYFEDLIKFLDWAVYSEEGTALTTWGVEGLTFENSSRGKVFLPDINTPKNPNGTIHISEEYGFDLFFNLIENEEYEDYKKPVEIVEFLNRSLTAGETLELTPKLVLDNQAIEAIQIINEKLDPYVTETSRKFIQGKLDFENDWEEYINELEQRGYKTIETIWNDAWKKEMN